MFFIKKFISFLLLPLPFCLLIILIGCILLLMKNKIKTGSVFIINGFFLLSAFVYSTIPAETLIKRFEDKYPPVINYQDNSDVKWIVVLGGGYLWAPMFPVTEQISFASLVRLSEGIRIHNQLPNSKIILSSGKMLGSSVSGSRLMADLAAEFGVKENELILESESKDTHDQTLNIKKIVDKDSFILITSALHMPRAVAMFNKLEMNPVPAPVNFIVKGQRKLTPNLFFPTVEGFEKSGIVIHEYLGFAWAKNRGHI